MSKQLLCPRCNQPVQYGDGVETPPIYCSDCELEWETPEDLEDHRAVLEDSLFDEPDDGADLEAVEQWMWDHGGPQYQESEGPDESNGLF